ncbi:MAG: hypothetical protein MUQ25_12810 [Candidatus Aminicenantes bacterium]|nr:hypothetical protein [Candidatus Aminicenantes bacterium]
MTVTSIRPEPDALVVRSSCEGESDPCLAIFVRYRFSFAAGRIDVTAEIRNAGPKDVQRMSFGLGASALQTYNFSPYNVEAFPALNFCVYQRPDHVVAWHNPNPPETAGKPFPGRLRPGQAYRFSYTMLASLGISEVLEGLYRTVRIQPVRASLEIKNAAGPAEVIVRDAATGAAFYRQFLDKPAASPLTLLLPAGTYAVRANLFPAVVEKTFRVSSSRKFMAEAWTLESPP